MPHRDPLVRREYARVYQTKYRERAYVRASEIERQARYKADGRREKVSRKSALKKKFGITPEQYGEMLLQQGGVCAICRVGTTCLRGHTMPVDHDHKTGKVRGLLCGTCNSLLGYAKDDPAVLKSAIQYLSTA